MKRKLLLGALVLVFVLCLSVFVACAETVDDEALAAMIEIIDAMNKDKSETTNADYELSGLANYDGKSCTVKWTVSVTEGVKVLDMNEEGFVTIQVNWETPTQIDYTLTATLVNSKGKAYTDADGKEYTISFNRKVPAFVVTDYAGYKQHCDDKSKEVINVKAYVIGAVSVTSSSKGSLYLQDKEGHGYYAYAPTLDSAVTATDEALRKEFPFGTEVYVSGTGTVYSGQYEFNKGCAIRKTGRTATAAELPYEDVTAAFSAASNNKDTALIPYQNKLVEIKGAEMMSVDGSYYYFKAGEVQYNLYKTNYFISDADLDTLVAKFAVGNKATIKGVVSVYSSAYQIYPLDVNAISNVEEVKRTDAEKAALDKDNLTLSAKAIAKDGGNIALPAEGPAFKSAITWALKEGSTLGTIAEGKYTVATLPDDETKVTLVATITNGTAAAVTKEFEITVSAKPLDNGVRLNVTTMNMATAYPKDAPATTTVNGIGFAYLTVANYGAGMQFQNNAGTTLYNTTAINKITAITLVHNADKMPTGKDKNDSTKFYTTNFVIEFADNAEFKNAKSVQIEWNEETDATVNVEIPEGDFTYFRIVRTNSDRNGTIYLDSITIEWEATAKA